MCAHASGGKRRSGTFFGGASRLRAGVCPGGALRGPAENVPNRRILPPECAHVAKKFGWERFRFGGRRFQPLGYRTSGYGWRLVTFEPRALPLVGNGPHAEPVGLAGLQA